jgi:hypothetical protein
MPVEFPPQFPLSINIKTAKATGTDDATDVARSC